MKNNLLFFGLFIFQIGFSQESQNTDDKAKHTYVKFDLSMPFKANPNAGEIDPYTGEKGYWFVPDGLNARVGFGAHYDKWIGGGINTGIDWKDSECLVIAPIFGSIRLSPKVGEETRLTLDVGFGRSLTLSGEHLSGYFKKISFGIENDEVGLGIFIELVDYGFSKNLPDDIGSFTIGLSYLMF